MLLVGCTSGGGGADAGVACPDATPSAGSRCVPQTNAMLCEYRASDACIMQASCDTSFFTWSVTALPGCLPNPSVCPAAFADVPVGTSCSLASNYVCAYAEGDCACEPCTSDAGAAQFWRCNAFASAQCGSPRPLAGAACADDAATCDYSDCCTPPALGPFIQCVNGAWTARTNFACKCAPSVCP